MSELIAEYRATIYDNSSFCVHNVAAERSEDMPRQIYFKAGVEKRSNIYCTVLGSSLPTYADVQIKYSGEWKYDVKRGFQFRVDHYEIVSPRSQAKVIPYLTTMIDGIGPKTAKLIVESFGDSAMTVIENEPNRLLEIPGIGKKLVAKITESYSRTKALGHLTDELNKLGISSSTATKIYKVFGDQSLEKIEENPYCIIGICGFAEADKIAKAKKIMLDSDIRISACYDFALRQYQIKQGHMYVETSEINRTVLMILNKGIEVPISIERLETVLADKMAAGEAVIREEKVFSAAAYRAELETSLSISKMLSCRIPNNEQQEMLGAYTKLLSHSSFSPAEEQDAAIRMALTNRISIITGGPGTGKTTVMKAIIIAYQETHPNNTVTLAAPSAKAAQRMSDSTGFPASTIHSALGLGIESEDYTNSEMLPDGLVMVDESSMIDGFLARALVTSVSSASQLVIVGDVNQLPSVDAGDVLRQLIECGKLPVTRLTKVFRQAEGSCILDNARRINEGNVGLTYNEEFSFIETDNVSDTVEAITDAYLRGIAEYGIKDVMVLSPKRVLRHDLEEDVCTEHINRKIQARINPAEKGALEIKTGVYTLRAGDRVLQRKNTEELANGETGTVKRIFRKSDDSLWCEVEWDNGLTTECTRDQALDIELAYAISVHKAQGMEYSKVVFTVYPSHGPLLKRNLIYTALTRPKKCVEIIGSRKSLAIGIKNAAEDEKRNTTLGERIQF